MGLEETHDGGHEVPCEIDGGEEDDGAHGNLVREEHLDILHQAALPASSLGSLKLCTFLQLALQVPGYESHDEQREEYDARGEHVGSLDSEIGTTEGKGHGLHPVEEIATRGKEHTKEQDAHRAETPRHLRNADISTTVVDLRRFRDIGPRGRNTHADADARDQESAEQHGEVDAEHDEQHTCHVDQQVIGEDELTAILVGQESADDGTKGSTKAVGTDEVEPAKVNLGESKVVLPQRQARCTSHNGTRIKIIGERHGYRALQTSIICHFFRYYVITLFRYYELPL